MEKLVHYDAYFAGRGGVFGGASMGRGSATEAREEALEQLKLCQSAAYAGGADVLEIVVFRCEEVTRESVCQLK
jgi:hypothetical protein